VVPLRRARRWTIVLSISLLVGAAQAFAAPIAHAAYPGANGRIAYSTYAGISWNLYSMKADGSHLTPLANSAMNEFGPVWSPNGRSVAWTGEMPSGAGDIFRARSDGTRVRDLTNGAADDTRPTWSPDGSKIAFSRDGGGGGQIWVMPAVGGNATQLTTKGGS